MSKAIQLTQGKITLVSDHRFEYLNQWKWCAQKHRNGKWYAVRGIPRVSGKQGKIYMHRVIANAPSGTLIDHRDGNGLNNQDNNIRFCSNGQNQANKGKRTDSTHKYKGIIGNKDGTKWIAKITVSGMPITIGDYPIPEEAARAYDRAALEYFGEFAYLNFPIKQNTQEILP